MVGAKVTSKKKPEDFAKMEIAGQCVAAMHRVVREAAGPGVTTRDLDAVAAEVVRERGCRPSFLGYHGFPATICASPNSAIVHGIPDGYTLRNGDIISIDAGAIYEGWHGDAAFTMAIGDVPDEVHRLLDVTEEALWNGMRQFRSGNRLGDIGHAIEATAEPFGYGVVREYIGHGIGRQMHEPPQVPNYFDSAINMRFQAGMVMAIEPMINQGGWRCKVLPDKWTVVTADGSASAHFEDTIAVTDGEPLILTRPEGKLT